MRKNLWLIDLTLLGLVLYTGTIVRDRWNQAELREQTLLRTMVPVAPVPVIPGLPGVSPVTPSAYMEIAQQFVFSRDRNPVVVIDPPPPPPPPPPMPNLPLAYGVMDLGTGPTIVLIDKPGGQQKGYRVGDTIGAFKVIALNSQDITFEWEGKALKKRIVDLVDKKALEAPPQQQTATQQRPATTAPQLTTLAPVKAGPGVELGETSRACVPGDTTPDGTVQDGFKKVSSRNPFGISCRWEKVN
ncbi:MAG: hypothetical protein H7Y20_13930 [Bryobacteraceae bacterium]|nr:hypothetical protein [Bryobacteraceae bacterium]